LLYEEGECSCPVGADCKHVVALVLTAAGAERPAAAPVRKAPPTWQQSLDALLKSPGDATNRQQVPLAIELTLSASIGPTSDRPMLKVWARLVKPGKNSWVAAVPWSKLNVSYHHDGYEKSHVRLLQEIYGVYRSAQDRYGHYYHHDEKTIDLSEFDSHRLWPLLDEADAIGLRVVHGKKRLGDVDRYGSAELCLDVTQIASSGSLVVTPTLHLVGRDDADVAPFCFIGSDGHGVVHVDRAAIQDPARAGQTGAGSGRRRSRVGAGSR